jgi:hypothetical protein
MHRFGAYVRFKNPDGTLNTGLLGKDGAHWSYLLDTQGSIMYGNGWKDNGNGTFTSTATMSGYSPLDLYLMGMIPKEKVPPMLLIDNPAIDKTQLPQLGATITGTANTVTIDDIIAAEGARVPDSTTSQKKFNVGYVLLTRSGDNATAAAQAIETLRTAFAGRFTELTQGTGGVNGVTPSVSVMIDSPADGATIIGPDVTVSGAIINSTGAETGVTVNGMPTTVSGSHFIVNHVPLQTGANSLTITATDANGLSASATRSVTASAGNYIRITSNIESGVAPLDITLRIDGSFSADDSTLLYPDTPVVVPLELDDPEEYGFRITGEGTYEFTAEAVGPDGHTYTDTVTITVVSKTAIDGLLRSKWNNLAGSLLKGDVNSALSVISSQARPMYQDMFTALAGQLPAIIATQREFNLISVTQGQGMYELVTQENGTIYSYDVIFSREDNGLWALDVF